MSDIIQNMSDIFTYFKIQGTYFLPSENPFENLLENADKRGTALLRYSLRVF